MLPTAKVTRRGAAEASGARVSASAAGGSSRRRQAGLIEEATDGVVDVKEIKVLKVGPRSPPVLAASAPAARRAGAPRERNVGAATPGGGATPALAVPPRSWLQKNRFDSDSTCHMT
jgi:hypothetical protein